MCDISFSTQSLKYLKKLNKSDSKRIISSLERCRIRPHSHIKKLVSSPYFRLRVDDYRLILDIKNGKMKIIVI